MDLRNTHLDDADASQRLSLIRLMSLTEIAPERYEGPSAPNTGTRIFGGQVLAQAVMAAGLSLGAERVVHQVDAQFLRAGDTSAPVRFHVEQLRDGRAFATRRVEGRQHDRLIFHAVVSGQVPESGLSHQIPVMPDVPGPQDSPPPEEWLARFPGQARVLALLQDEVRVELRFPQAPVRVAALDGLVAEPYQTTWFRCRDPLSDDPLVRVGALAYLSDLLLLSTGLAPHVKTLYDHDLRFASLNHALWVHEPRPGDEWLLYQQESSWAGHGRTLCHGLIFARDGTLCATVGQEGLFRVIA